MVTASFTAKIADFGESKALVTPKAEGHEAGVAFASKSGGLVTVRGTPTFMAPEVFKAEPYGAAADVFSFSLVLLERESG